MAGGALDLKAGSINSTGTLNVTADSALNMQNDQADTLTMGKLTGTNSIIASIDVLLDPRTADKFDIAVREGGKIVIDSISIVNEHAYGDKTRVVKIAEGAVAEHISFAIDEVFAADGDRYTFIYDPATGTLKFIN